MWKNLGPHLWQSYKWHLRNSVDSLPLLERVVSLTLRERDACRQAHSLFRMGISPYYASLMSSTDPYCPVRRQAIPLPSEFTVHPTEASDPLQEEVQMPVNGLTHRYPDRVLLYLSEECAMYCRHCTRKRKVGEEGKLLDMSAGLSYIRSHREIRDVILSGGDPLLRSDDFLAHTLRSLRSIPHVEVIRIGTRTPVTLPFRITPALATILSRYQPIFVNTHFNHPMECTRESVEAVDNLIAAGCTVSNQMVLLRGINDSVSVVRQLNQTLLKMRVRPYYIFQCDPVEGVSHFRTPVSIGMRIMEGLRGWTSGLAVPYFVIDTPGGKIPLLPSYVVKREGKTWTLRNYQGKRFQYVEP